MQWLANISVRRPVFASVLILSLTVVGAFSFFNLGLDRYPKVDFPTIVVTTRQPGASPEQIETEVTDRVEEAVNTISGIDELRSVSAEGVSQVIVSFLLEKDTDVAAQEVRDKINRVLPLLPKTIDQPTVEKFDPDAAPIMTLALSSDRPIREVTEFADKTLRRQLESVSGVGQVLVVGGRGRQINVWLNGERLRAYNLTVTDVQRALESQNAEIPGGRVEQGAQTLTLRTVGRLQSIDEFGRVVVRQREGHPILLGDVARIEDGMAEADSLANLNGTTTVMLQIRRQSGTNTVQVVDALKERLTDMSATLPAAYKVRVVRDQSEFIKTSVRTVEEHLVIGSLLAALVVLVFLWNARSTAIAAIAIPTSIIATFGLIWYMGFTLNSMTMLALTLAVGIVIDDAIVVLENIWKFIEEKGRPPFQAAIEATREIGLAVMATTMSLVAIFIPVGFMGGIVGRFMKSFGLTMAFAVLVSLVVSFTLTPMMSARWLRRPERAGDGEHDARHSRFFAPIDQAYTRLMQWSLHHRGFVAAGALLVLLSSIPLFMLVNKTFLPDDDQSEFEVSVRAPEGTSLEATDLLLTRIASRIRERLPEVEFTLVTTADDPARTPNQGSVYVRLKPLEDRTRDQFVVMADVRSHVLKEFDGRGLRTRVQAVANIGGGGNQNAAIQLLVAGPDLKTLERVSRAVAERGRAMRELVDVDTSLNVGKPEVSVRVDRLKASDLGVEISDAANALRLLVGGDEVTTYYEGGEQYDVRLRAEARDRMTTGAIGSLPVPSARLGGVPLENVAAFTRSAAPSEINRVNRQRQVTVFANLLPGMSQTTPMNELLAAFQEMNPGSAYQARFAGRSRELGRAAQNFLLAFLLSLVFMYLILAAQFESWLHPITILLSLPLTLPFALLSIMLTGQSLNIFSALGLLVLFGVVKKNAILQIDHAIQLRESGLERDAAIVQSSRDRLRPILMTTLAFVAGMVPLVVSSGTGSATNRAIGFVIIGGQTLVLALTLIMTPVAYSLLDDVASLRWLGRVKARLFPARARAAAETAGMIVLALAVAAPLLAQPVATPQPPAPPETVPAPPPPLPPAPPPAVPQPATPGVQMPKAELTLTVDEAIRRAIENNPDLAIVRLDPLAAQARVEQATSNLGPLLTGIFGGSEQNQPPTSFLVGAEGSQTDDVFTTAAVRQRLPWGGGTYLAGWDTGHTTSNSPITSFSPSVTSQLSLAFSQPLLRDRSIDFVRQQIIITKRNKEVSDLRFQEAVLQTTSQVKRSYWDLVAARALVDVQRRSLELAQELERMNTARVDVGQAPPLDKVAAQAEVAQRREQLIAATTLLGDVEDRLRTLIMPASDRTFWSVRLVPTDTPPPGGPSPDPDAAVTAALEGRLDLERARKDVENADTEVRFFENQKLPDVRLEASYRANGQGGSRLIREGGFPGTVVGSEDIGFGSVMDQVFGLDYPTWTVGLTVSYPLGRSYEEAGLARAQVERQQAQARVDSLAIRATQDVRQAARQIDSAAQRIDATRASRELAQQRLDAERKRYEVGMSTSFLVVQAQRDLAQAEQTFLRAMLDYQISLIDFETLQQAPLTAGAVGISGGSIIQLQPGTPRGVSRSIASGSF